MKYFTPEEANAQIPRLETLMRSLRGLMEEMRANQTATASLDNTEGARGGNGHSMHLESRARALQAERKELEARLQRGLEEASNIGVEIKDINDGLADFRTMREGREVYLCWRMGEQSIDYWHELDTGYSGRQHL